MLQTIAEISTLAALLFIIPAFITAFAIIKEISLPNLRAAKYFKILLLQTFVYSLFLVAMLFYKEFKTAFLIHSFGMLPLFALLLLRLYHQKWQKQQYLKIQKLSVPKPNKSLSRKQVIQKLRLKARARKSQWH